MEIAGPMLSARMDWFALIASALPSTLSKWARKPTDHVAKQMTRHPYAKLASVQLTEKAA